ncbi:unnamed protein product [Calypogeia fissa]
MAGLKGNNKFGNKFKNHQAIPARIAEIGRFSNLSFKVLLLVCILAITIFMSVAYRVLQEQNHLRIYFPGSALLIDWHAHNDAVSVDRDHRSRQSENEPENKSVGLNETRIAYASTDPAATLKKPKISTLLEGNWRHNSTDQRGTDDPNVEIGKGPSRGSVSETWMLEIQKPRYNGSWPRFHQLLQIWALNRRYDPLSLVEVIGTMKKTLDNFYQVEANHTVQQRMDHGGESDHERYRTCAVVGNSGILLKQKLGSFIDSHDAVIRLNNAKLRWYQEYVGKKTTISFVNSHVYLTWTRHLNCLCHPGCHPYGNIPIVMYMCQAEHLMDVALCESRHSAPVPVTDPRFDTLCMRLVKWYSVKNYVEVTGNPIKKWAVDHYVMEFHYSSGFQAVKLALGMCEKVDIFGFGKSESAKHHYHSNQKAELSLHDYAAEYLFYEDLAHNRTSSIPFFSETGIRLPVVTIYR